MRFVRCCFVAFVLLIVAARALPAQNLTAQQAAVKAVLMKQEEDWNKGDLDAFETGYKNSPDIVFMGGGTLKRGYDGMVASYRKSFGTPEKRGVLSFSELEVRVLDARFASVIGRFHLVRTAAGGGDSGGPFSLLFEKTAAGWKIILDHTDVDPQPVANPPGAATH